MDMSILNNICHPKRVLKKILLVVILIVLGIGLWASPDIKEISAGTAIFLFGMIALEDGFRIFAGGVLEKILAKTTNTFWKSLSFGIVTTTLMQSSSLVSVITISFLSAGLLGLAAGIGIIFGANLGTTTGAWLIAGFGLKVKISAYAMPMLVFGIVLLFQSSKALRGIGSILAGLGFLFLGIHYMKTGFESFKDTIDLAEYAIGGYAGLFIFASIGTVATVIMQSSHATLVLIITALAAGQVTYENALALAVGANIGTTITSILGSISANHRGRRLAAAHLIFNFTTALIAIVLIQQIIWSVDGIANLAGIREDDYTLKLAIFHSIFNLIGVCVMAPFIGRLVTLLEYLIPARTEQVEAPLYLNNAVIDFPETLMEALYNEILHLYDTAFEIMAHGLSLNRSVIQSDANLQETIGQNRRIMHFDLDQVYTTKVKALNAAILEFMTKAQPFVSSNFSKQFHDLRDTSQRIIRIVKDIKHLRKNINRFILSDNEDIRREYNAIRLILARTLRDVWKLRQQTLEDGDEEECDDILDLEAHKLAFEESNLLTAGTLDQMIREHRITAEMGTSLMNDLSYARGVVWRLVEIGKLLHHYKNEHSQNAEAILSLEEEEIAEAAIAK